MGTGPAPVGNPRPRSSHQRTTPSAAARPNAEPPVSTTASTLLDGAEGIEQVELPGGRRPAPHLARRGGADGQEHDGAPGAGHGIGPVPDPDPLDVGDHGSTVPSIPVVR